MENKPVLCLRWPKRHLSNTLLSSGRAGVDQDHRGRAELDSNLLGLEGNRVRVGHY